MFCFSYSVILLRDFVEKISLFKYFQRKEIPKEERPTAACEFLKENPPECITVEDMESVQKSLQVDKLQNKKRYVCGEKEKQEIAKFALEHGHARVGQTRGRPLVLDVGLDSKLLVIIIYLRTAGEGINQYVVSGVLIGL